MATSLKTLPDANGYFGAYGGQCIPPPLKAVMDEITDAYLKISKDPAFQRELAWLLKHYVGRPSPVYHCRRLSAKLGGADIYLKREDLNHTGAHKINHCLGEVLLAKAMGKRRVIAETGAGQHGVAMATAAALMGLECEIHMGVVDVAKQHPNVTRMKILGAKVVPVSEGAGTLKEAVDSAFREYMNDTKSTLYAIGSVVGPHPFPMMVRDFQKIVSEESRGQMQEITGRLPDAVIACVGGGSNAMGAFYAYLDDPSVRLIGVEPAGRGLSNLGDHAATMTLGKPGEIHGFKCYVLTDAEGNPAPVHSIASGLDYPGVGPEHSNLKDIGRVIYESATDQECLDAFMTLSRLEGIIPALESSHAVAYALRVASALKGQNLLINLSGRGDKDVDYVAERLGI